MSASFGVFPYLLAITICELTVMRGPSLLIRKKRVLRIAIHRRVNVQALLRWLAVILWMGAIFAVSHIPSISTGFEPGYDFTSKKLAHMIVYGILTVLLFAALRVNIRRTSYALVAAILLTILYAFSDEWHQTFVPGRNGTLRDVAFDAVGAVNASLWLRSKSREPYSKTDQ